MVFYEITTKGLLNLANWNTTDDDYTVLLEKCFLQTMIRSVHDNDPPSFSFPTITFTVDSLNDTVSQFLVDVHSVPYGRFGYVNNSSSTANYIQGSKERIYDIGGVIETNTIYNRSNRIRRLVVEEVSNTPSNLTLVDVSLDDGGTWSTGKSLGVITDFTGTSNGGGNYRLKLKFYQDSVLYYWTVTTSLNYAKKGSAGCGTYTDALSYSGLGQGETELWNGSIWTTTTSHRALFGLAMCGTTSDALAFGGGTTTIKDYTDIWDGSTWATTSALTAALKYHAGCGTTTDALSFGGNTNNPTDKTEIWDGSTWATTSALNTARDGLAGCGTTTNALSFGGGTTDAVVTVEIWIGDHWATTNSMNQSKRYTSGCGTVAGALSFGGSYITEKRGGSSWSTTNQPSMTYQQSHLAGVGATDGALALGGYRYDSPYSSVEKYDLASQFGFGVKIN